MKLKTLFESFSSLSEFPGLDSEMEVTGITDDSRNIKPGMIFIAIKGFQFDGHNYIMDAAKNGASLIIGETPQNDLMNTPYMLVKNSRKMLGQLTSIFYENPSSKKIVIGVTGTNGKTTTCYLLKHLLEKLGYTTSLIGTIEYVINGETSKSLNTTPSSLLLQQMMAHSNDQVIILEVSSHGLTQYRLEGITFDYALFTNLQHDHLDYHHTMDEYFEAKALLFDKLKPNGKAVINSDDAWGNKLTHRLVSKNVPLIAVGTNDEAAFRIVSKEGKDIQIDINQSLATLQSTLIGVHNMYNLAMASAVVVDLGHSIQDISNNLVDFAGIPGRFETVAVIDEVHYIIDYAHSDLALQYCLESIKECDVNKIIHIFGFRGKRDATKRLPMLETSQQLSDYTLLTTDDLNGVSENEMMTSYQDLVKEADFTDHIKIIMDRTIAIQEAQKLAQPRDYVVLTGKGPESYTEAFQMGTHSDKETILQLKNMHTAN
ncbi:UDP-N-acetylmuramoyl-L-alanyl-D-glutamate--2,6-diaminopimelate ligase [Desemzia sp. RIT804]|uniref:UDP-N-acetylmuramoyl-L-alanyl-D-glutamate--2, 6-diaminopimelate ligase n=1 Tax=Desemzia sp. RIT 804 TaxID=2810209 RepID=UPI00194EBFB9|nr:UDP-N-acetylmuramoyl-L-alanyl-D-glutamate--2,6-diaminopimelate ligase [Desemzia sp. RIT 804]MBM6614671.1 UDP-N-acetylmuramoyl-L-alanyl-D-glutamate--2,6-diaminopimelate ligase [Desemzia sp. RIT 804]